VLKSRKKNDKYLTKSLQAHIKPVDILTSEYEKLGADYIQTGPTFAEGVDCEIFSLSALIEAWENASLKSEREHCTLYLRNHPEKFMKKETVPLW
jgi:spore coat polysaccharide biosynthesis protein SpsF (cytidylyltransferase family)